MARHGRRGDCGRRRRGSGTGCERRRARHPCPARRVAVRLGLSGDSHGAYRDLRKVPVWSVMPLVGTPESQWPPFSIERFFGRWFWKDYQAGNIVLLDSLIAANPGIVFWLDTYQALGSACCVVASDIKTSEGRILRRGKYVGAAALRAGVAVPSLTNLLAEARKTDLALRFQVSA